MKPFAIKTELMHHQRDAVAKQARTRAGALFMEMGTGKTLTAIALAHYRMERIRNVVWFCPVSVKDTIRRENLKHTDCNDEDIYLFDYKTKHGKIPAASWLIIGIESMSASARLKLSAQSVIYADSMVIVDESTYIKGYHAARTNWITAIAEPARYRMILTGTPMTQGIIDLYAQMRFLSPEILGYKSFYSFAANHLEYSEKYPGKVVRAHNTEWLAAKMQPYVYQVTKAECLDLPDKLYETRYTHLTLKQQVEYSAAKERTFKLLEKDEFNSYAIFQLFTELQKIVSGYITIENKIIELAHFRIDCILDIIAEIPANSKITIWAKFQYDIDSIIAALEKTYGGGCCARYDGSIVESRRSDEIARFEQSARFIVLTPSCGGHGLNQLVISDYVIFYNNGFKYSERIQAEDRNHRPGQTKPVTYIDIHCSNSIDDRIADALSRKGNVLKDFQHEIEKVKDKGKLKKLIEEL
ncbi:MAG: DEAD/DEAH box helicase [Lentisphaerota bacterium]